ncbi:MAG: DUF932 domain-containing protein [Leptospirales bacterium]|jgi:hypothetical protein
MFEKAKSSVMGLLTRKDPEPEPIMSPLAPRRASRADVDSAETPTLVGPALATAPMAGLSGDYEFVSTREICEKFLSHGFVLKAQHVAGVRSHEREGLQAHVLLFTHPDLQSEEGNLQLAVRNSHDGSKSLEIFSGYFRLACSNQLYRIQPQGRGAIRLLHRSYNRQALQNAADQAIASIESTQREVKILQNTVWSEAQMKRYAKEVLSLRFATRIPNVPFRLLNQPWRKEDEGNQAWKVVNRMQEKLVKGGVQYQDEVGGRYMRTRELKSLSRLPELNSAMWDAALALK